ncbi:tetratricopeptide repeat protein [Elusimicrobiota bacterium]
MNIINIRWILIIYLTALVLRLIYFFETVNTPILELLHIDSQYYHEWAVQIAGGDIFGGKKIFTMAPLYAYFLALIYVIFGNNYLSAIIIQIIVGSLSCVLIFLVAKKYFDKKTAIISSVIAALYPIFIFYDATLLKENLMIFFTLLFVFVYPMETASTQKSEIQKFDRKNILLLLLAGTFIGIHSLMRPNIFALIPLIFLYELFYLKTDKYFLFKKFIILFIGIFIIVFPVSLRNKIVGGEFVVTVASSGMNFWTGNNISANGTYQGASFITSEEPEYEEEDFRLEASKRSGRDLTIKQASRFWLNEGLDFISKHPKRYIWLLYRKILGFFHNIELPTDLNYYFGKDFSAILKYNIISFGLIVPFALIGIYITFRKKNINYMFLSVILYNLISSLIFFNTSRYRLPAVPIFIIYNAYFLSFFLKARSERMLFENEEKKGKRDKHTEKLIINPYVYIPVLAVLFFFVNHKDSVYTNISSKSLSYVNSASYYMRDSKLDKAEAMLKKALEIDPRRSLVNKMYYELLKTKGDTEGAKMYLENALRFETKSGHKVAKPDTMEAAYQYFMQKQYGKALSIFQSMLENGSADEKELRNNIGLCYLRLGDFQKAEEEFNKALLIDKNYDKALYNLGLLYEMKGDTISALDNYRKTLQINPNHTRAKKKINSLK